jgi:hypothetical protein
MIEAGLEFDDTIDRVVKAFVDLPAPLRPVYFSHEEEPASDADLIEDQKRFSAFVTKSKSGIFLLGPGVTYSIRFATDKSVICNCFFHVAPRTVEPFLKHMAQAKPGFGFACSPSERERRNRVTTQQGLNTIESWVGRDTQKYVPGFYWLTLLPDALAQRHGIPLASVEAVAQEHIELEGGQHLFRFYERPDDWQDTPAVTQLCASLPGVFDVDRLKPQLLAAKDFLDLNSMLRDWK